MSTMSYMRVESMKHEYDSYGFFFSRIAVGSKCDDLSIVIFDFELDLIFDGKNMVALWIMTFMLLLLCLLDHLLPLFISQM